MTSRARSALVAITLAACAGATPASRPIDWRSEPEPAVDREPEIAAPAVREGRLHNGVRVVVAEDHRIRVVSITTLHARAGSREDAAQLGVAALAVDLLAEGASGRDAAAFATAIAREGMRLEPAIATDYAALRVTALSTHLAPAVGLLAQALRQPRFDDAAFARVRARHLAELEQQRLRVRTISARVFDRVVFGPAHPYARSPQGTTASVGALSRDAAREFWQHHYGPASTTIVVAGDVALEPALGALDRAFADWRDGDDAAPAAPPPAAAAATAPLAHVRVPGARWCALLVGAALPPDRDPTVGELANAVVGGSNDARLARGIDRELGIASNAASGFWRGEWSDTWAIAMTVPCEHAGAALERTRAVIADARATAPTRDELERARALLVRSAAQSFDTTAGTARALERLVLQRLPLDYYARLPARLAAVTPEAARDAIARVSREPSVIVVGDAPVAELGGGVAAASFDLDGEPVR
jgi:zinc protease